MRLITFFPLSLLGLLSTPAFAEVVEYDIEILIFEDATHQYINSEQWPRLVEPPLIEGNNLLTTDDTTTKASEADANTVIDITNNDADILGNYVKKIDASSRYHVLLHKSWRQTGLDAESAINIPINSLENSTSDSMAKLNNKVSNAARDNILSSNISGNIKVVLGRYLHVYTDLIYKIPNASNSPLMASSQDDQYKYYAVKSHRRMRSKELHYLDHPLVGVLVKILPVEIPDENLIEKRSGVPEKL